MPANTHAEVMAVQDTSGNVISPTDARAQGTWAYKGGVSGTVTVPAGGRVLDINAHSTAGGSMTINGGDSIPIPANFGFTFTPMGNLVAPTIVFTSTDSYAVEYVT
jgi:hypothetical protein